jgi:hypothetical protein
MNGSKQIIIGVLRLIVRIRWTPVFGKRRRPTRAAPRRSKLLLGVLMLAPGLPVSTIADMPPRAAMRQILEPVSFHAPAENIDRFMREHDFAKPYNVPEIIQAAAQASIPPSLIVCIEFYESSGGKYYDAETNNPLGWKNGQMSFSSKSAAIRHVSAELGSGRWYAGKTLEEKLHMYNPRPVYSQKVMQCMSEFPR